MENINIHAYMDGNDVIVVFKNTDKNIQSVIMSVLSSMTGKETSVRQVPGLDAPTKEAVEVKKVETLKNIIPDFLQKSEPTVNEVPNDCEKEKNVCDKDTKQTNQEKPVVADKSKDVDDKTKVVTNKPAVVDKPKVVADKTKAVTEPKSDGVLISYGKYSGKTPEEAIKKDGENGFITIVKMHKPEFDKEKKLAMKTAARSYYNSVFSKKPLIAARQEMEQTITNCYRLCKPTIDAKLKEFNYNSLSTFSSLADEKMVRDIYGTCLNAVKKIVGDM